MKFILSALAILLASTALQSQTPAPTAPQTLRYQCATSGNLKTEHLNFDFDFTTHTVTETVHYEFAAQHLRDLKFEESGDQLILRAGCAWSTKPLGCATINRKTLSLSIYAWGPRGGEDAPSGDTTGGNNVVVYECFQQKAQ
jgi:hypothetical protein